MLELYMGFMDEEVNDILRVLIQRAREEKTFVLVFERAGKESFHKRIFERNITSYGLKENEIKINTLVSAKHKDKTLKEGTLKYHRWYEYDYGPKSKIKTKSDVHIIIITPSETRRGEGIQRKKPLILIRSPEMGLQPDMTQRYLGLVFGEIMKITKDQLNISCFGAGGAVAEGLEPGTSNDVYGSFYVGVEVEKNPKVLDKMEREYEKALLSLKPYTGWKKIFKSYTRELKKLEAMFHGIKYHSVVLLTLDSTSKYYQNNKAEINEILSWAPKLSGQTYQIFRSTKYYNFENGIELASKAFECLCDERPNIGSFREEKQSLSFLRNKGFAAKNTVKCFPANTISLTGSFFIGAKIKAAARKLQLGDANMEDYHVLRTLNTMRYVHGAGGVKQQITRVHCDPPEIRPNFEVQFKKWATEEATYSPERFKSAIIWGLNGCALGMITKAAHWDFADKIPKTQRKKYVYPFPGKDHQFYDKVLDPFYSEIASDFLNTVKDDSVKAPAFLLKKVKIKSEARIELKEIAAKILDGDKELIDKLIMILLSPKAYNSRVSPFNKDGNVRVWVRPGKYGNPDTTLINEVKWEGANIDRALYKSTNQIVLQLQGPEVPRMKRL